ncbi:ATP-binding protein [Streptomyces sp. DSM 44915]|uniref:histidine kinase n=1 Tax=Streptomyces chisholmiae TaxID=3075540 RepID=A0ABU2JU69_9ACTN|nr:ATP-binding protein [Streptomyces sp. DSM 44915]MDT0268540.1 ATP-binding protein [Streptomyces sp. DSM 44915]
MTTTDRPHPSRTTTGTTRTTTGTTTRTTTTDRRARGPFRVSARFRILLWVVVLMAVSLVTVVVIVRSVLWRDMNDRVNQILAQETAEFHNFVEFGRDVRTGQSFTDPRQLLTDYLTRQFPEPAEELIGFVPGPSGGTLVRQPREIRTPLPLHEDPDAVARIVADPDRAGTLRRAAGEVRWARLDITHEGSTEPAVFIVAFHPQEENSSVRDVVGVLVVVAAGALVLTSAVGWWVAGNILAPVRLVRNTAARLTEQDLAQRIPVADSDDDVAALARTFNAMLDRLEAAFATQRRFVDDAGHELRTPITIVRGHLELMSDGEGEASAAERRETLRLVSDELDRMSRIVEDLLLLAKAEQPDFVRPEPVQLAELTADVYVKARALGDRRWELAEVADHESALDPQRITQAMVQLAQNAVSHTAPGDLVRIGSRRLPDRIELYVADTGPGVPEADREVVFDRFWRGAQRRGGGAGLGLSIVRAIAEGHHGRAEVRPTPGGGATFVLLLETP